MSSNIFEAAVDLLCFAFSTLSRAQDNDTSNEQTFKQFNNISSMRKTKSPWLGKHVYHGYSTLALLIYKVGEKGREVRLSEFTSNCSFRPALKMLALDMFKIAPCSSISLCPLPPPPPPLQKIFPGRIEPLEIMSYALRSITRQF